MWRHSHVKTIRAAILEWRLSMLHDARMQNAVQTWQLIDLPLKYVRYRYPVQVICETWVHWLHSSRLSHTSCTPRRPSCAEVSRSYAELHHFSSRDENAIDIYQWQHMRTPPPSLMLPKMKYPTTLLVFLLVVYNVSSTRDLPAAYRFSATLDPNGLYELYWNYNLTLQTISFAVRVQTTGWVGFGVSPNGQMPGSDVVIGWVDNNGRVQFDVKIFLCIS